MHLRRKPSRPVQFPEAVPKDLTWSIQVDKLVEPYVLHFSVIRNTGRALELVLDIFTRLREVLARMLNEPFVVQQGSGRLQPDGRR